MEQSKILQHVLEKAGNANLIPELVEKLSPSEMVTLLLALSKEIAAKNAPSDIVSKYRTNRFVKPSGLDPVQVKQIEISMLQMAKAMGFLPVLLSPASLLGSCSVMAQVDQNNVVSATRGLELISDSTNMLAIYLADGIKNKTMDNARNFIHLAAVSRVTRGQMFKEEHFVPHFGLFAMVSSGKDSGSYGFEKAALLKHIGFYIRYFGEQSGHRLQVYLNARKGYTDRDGFLLRLQSSLEENYPGIDIVLNQTETDNRYYQGVNFKVNVDDIPIVDGGFVDWTQKILNNKKERLLISGAGIDLQIVAGIVKEKYI